jgi:hypothetical protein
MSSARAAIASHAPYIEMLRRNGQYLGSARLTPPNTHQRVPVANPRALGPIGRHSQVNEPMRATLGATSGDRSQRFLRSQWLLYRHAQPSRASQRAYPLFRGRKEATAFERCSQAADALRVEHDVVVVHVVRERALIGVPIVKTEAEVRERADEPHGHVVEEP